MQALKRVIVFSAHPDDAEISAGGTIAKLRKAGVDVCVVNVTIPEFSPKDVDRRRDAASQASRILDYRLQWVDEGKHIQVEDIKEYKLVAVIDSIVESERPDIVFGPWNGDSHVDHARLARAIAASSRRWGSDLYAYCPAEFLSFRFQYFHPTLFVDIGAFVDLKRAAIRCFNYDGHSTRAVDDETLSLVWAYYGALSGFTSAEGFMVLRSRWPRL